MSKRPTTTLIGVFDPSRVRDQSPRTGVFEGDLKYGRLSADGVAANRQDYSSGRNPDDPDSKVTHYPAMPLKLVEPRDPTLWTKDPAVKDAKRSIADSQGDMKDLNQIMNIYKASCTRKSINFHLTVGKQHLSVA